MQDGSKQPLVGRAQDRKPRSYALGGSRLARVLRSKITGRSYEEADAPMSLEQLAHARLGQVLRGKYRLDRVLGVGGMAAVYAATHRNRRTFAVKLLHPELSSHKEIRTRFQREGYVTNSVNHAGTVAVLDDDVAEDGSAFLVMELLEGMSLDALWERHGRTLPVSAALAIADQVLDVLAAAHARAVVHRDLKPANLFLTRDGAVKVLDFGVARLRELGGDAATLTGTRLGTPAYMAPEQAFGSARELDETVDLWAVGATLFALISGQLVLEGDDRQQLVARLTTQSTRSLASVASGVPPAVVRVIDRALAFDKRERWPSALEMRTALQRAHVEAFGITPSEQQSYGTLAQLLVTHDGTSAPARARRLARIRRFAWLGLAALMLALAALTLLRSS